MHCSKCGKQVSDEAIFCRYCGNRLDEDHKGVDSQGKIIDHFQNDDIKKYKKYFVMGIIVILLVFYIFVFRCKSGFCPLLSTFRGDYCIIHTCNRNGCYNKVVKGKEYCYTHMPSTLTNYNYIPEKAEDVIDFSNISISSNSSYTICTATVTNNGKRTYTFVEVKGKFKNSSGTVLDTDWTYAVGSEELAPGESVSIRLSVKKNSNIVQCDLEIMDYDRKNLKRIMGKYRSPFYCTFIYRKHRQAKFDFSDGKKFTMQVYGEINDDRRNCVTEKHTQIQAGGDP